MRILVAALACMLLLPSAAFAVKINEIMYNPAADNSYAEWIEIWNDGSQAVDLTGWRLCGSPLAAGYITFGQKNFTPTHNTGMLLPVNGYAIITDGGLSGSTVLDNFAVDGNALLLHVGGSSMCGGLSNDGDTVTLTSTNGVVDNVTYAKNAAKQDFSIERSSDGWLQSLVQKGTPGYVNSIVQQNPPSSPSSCTPNWQCSSWNACTDGHQGRTCTDLNRCGTAAGEPDIIQACNAVTTPAVSYANKVAISMVDAPAQAVAGSRLELSVKMFNDFPEVKEVVVSAFLAGQNPGDGYTYVLDPKQSKTVLVPLEVGKNTGPTMLYARVSDGSSSWTANSPLTITADANTTVTQPAKPSSPTGAFALNIDLSVLGQMFGNFWSWITDMFSSSGFPRSVSN